VRQLYRRWTPYFIIALIGAVVGGGLVLVFAGNFFARPAPKNLILSTAYAGISDARNTPVVRAAQMVGPAVVGIVNKTFAIDRYTNKQVLQDRDNGSGVIINPDGYIVTNFHVVENAEQLSISLADGRVFAGKTIGVDPVTDLAVVKIDGPNLPAAVLGDSDSLMVGEPAIAIGNPLGLEFRGSVTAGVISALNRSIEIGERRFKLIQTDAAINPGNSGGALVNADGMVIGINSAKISVQGVEGIGFAIPINSARPIIQSIIEKGRVIRAYLGVGVLDKKTALMSGRELNIDKGVYIVKITPGGPADKAGIIVGDIILKLNGIETNSVADLRGGLDTQPVGGLVKVVINRDGQLLLVTVKLEEMPVQ